MYLLNKYMEDIKMKDLQDMTIGEFVKMFILPAILVEQGTNTFETKKYLSRKEVIEEYSPIFTEYSLRKAVKYEGLKVIKRGNKSYYERKSIDEWLERNNKVETEPIHPNVRF